jgi:F0F1-type ATP synthase delta subunit
MSKSVARKYARAVMQVADNNVEEVLTSLNAYKLLFDVKILKEKILSPIISNSDKELMLLGKETSNQAISNLVKMLIENDGLSLLPDIAEEARIANAIVKKKFDGIIYSNETFSNETISEITASINKQVDAEITFKYVASDVAGFKIEVPDLGLELSFAQDTMKKQLINHILKAI